MDSPSLELIFLPPQKNSWLTSMRSVYLMTSKSASVVLCYHFDEEVLSFHRRLKRNPGFDPGSTMSRKATEAASWFTPRINIGM